MTRTASEPSAAAERIFRSVEQAFEKNVTPEITRRKAQVMQAPAVSREIKDAEQERMRQTFKKNVSEEIARRNAQKSQEQPPVDDADVSAGADQAAAAPPLKGPRTSRTDMDRIVKGMEVAFKKNVSAEVARRKAAKEQEPPAGNLVARRVGITSSRG